ncbi:MAG: NAD-dependent epimerase/dehydratase family protein [Proteobacteria bacterium]|nr:NAD-dependent epimerase/dehydratase family protein [Pseudomonadota bacterium]
MTEPRPTLLTGATGFVGSAVARTLAARGHHLRLLVRRGSDRRNLLGVAAETVEGDLKDAASLRRAAEGCRYVLHVAADYRLWVPDESAMLAANVEGTRALMRAAMAAGAERVVYCSSVAALGLNADGSPADEATPVREADMIGVYKRSKFLAEQAVRRMVAEEGLPAVIVNPAGPVGPRDIKPTPTGKMILDAARGRIPAFLDTGLNIVHVDDVAEGHALALERGRIGEGYILGSENLMLGDILAMVARTVGRRPPSIRLSHGVVWPMAVVSELLARYGGIEPMLTRDHLKMAKKKMFFSSAKAQAELGYAPRPASAAVADAVAWFRQAGMLRG